MPADSGYRTAWWALASSVGFAIGKDVADILADSVSGPAGVALDGVIIGTCLGLAQWLVLRRHVADAHLNHRPQLLREHRGKLVGAQRV